MNKLQFSVIWILLIFFIIVRAQMPSAESRPLKSIIIKGNKHTNKEVILRELLFSEGDVVTDSMITVSKKRLENLWLFNRVEIYVLPDDKEISLLISVTERLFVFPFPIFTLNDRDWNKITYGFGAAHTNFRGWNEKVFGQLFFGNRPGYGFSYSNPWINRDLHLMAGVYLLKYSTGNHSYAFDERHFFTSFAFGKYWNRNFYSKFSLYRDAIAVSENEAPRMQTGTKEDVNYGLVFSTVYDMRDLYAYPSKGFYAKIMFKKSGFFEKAIDYTQYGFDFFKYFNWKGIILAIRLSTLQSLGTLPVYDRVYLGYSNRIRGHFNEVIEGRHFFMAGQALRFPLIKTRYYSVPSFLLPSSSTKNLKFGLNGGFFAERGIVWSRREQFASKNFIHGFGMGLHFLLPYIEVLRLDLAFDEKFRHEYIMEILMPF